MASQVSFSTLATAASAAYGGSNAPTLGSDWSKLTVTLTGQPANDAD